MASSSPIVRITPLTERRLLGRLAEVQRSGQLPSVVAGVVRDGRLVWSAGYGDVPGDPLDVQYRIGSITKTMTAVLVLQLVAEGRASLGDPVRRWLGDVGYADRTLGDLLAHGGGLQAEPAGPWWERHDGGSFDELAAANDGSGAVAGPGEHLHYSNLGYGLLGEVAARALDQSWWEAVRARVLEPLGMTRTTYHPDRDHAQGWSVHPYAATLTAEPHTDTGAMAPAGQLWSTVTDLARYCSFLLDGQPDVLAPAMLAVMRTPRSGRPEELLSLVHGAGLMLVPGGAGTLVGHTGSMPGFLAGCFVDPVRRTGGVLLANATTGIRPAAVLGDLLDDLETWEPAVPEAWRPNSTVPDEIRDLLGVWHWGNTPYVFVLEGEQLVVRLRGEPAYRFIQAGGQIHGVGGYLGGEQLLQHRDATGALVALECATFRFTRDPWPT